MFVSTHNLQGTQMRIFTKVNGKLVAWDVSDMTYDEAVKAVRAEVGLKHRGAILALVKY